MAGVIQFDRQAALDSAARAFWRKGYDATTVQDLEAATGLGRGSLYNAFGDKQALFLCVLERYATTVGGPTLQLLEATDGRAGVRAWLDAIVARMVSGEGPRGCLITNACLGGGAEQPAAGFVADAVRAIEAALEAALRRAQAAGQIPAAASPRALARFYCAVAQSLAVMHKAHADGATLGDVVDVAMDAWPR